MEDHRAIKVGMSKKQLSRLRNGHRVRMSPVMKGEGVCLVVNPANYDLITRTFSRNKGVEIALSPQELLVNKDLSPQMEGQGIFGKAFDRAVKKVVGKKNQRELYAIARDLLPLAQAGLTAGLTAGGTALGVAQPELLPFIAPGVAGLSSLGSDYLANPSKYQSNAGGSRAKLARDLAGRYAQDQALASLNTQLGTNMGNLSRASLQEALTNKALAELTARSVAERQNEAIRAYEPSVSGQGLYVSGLTGRGMRRTGGIVGMGGGLVSQEPPALRSQPFGANFQFQHTLPPPYQRFSKGSGLYI